jgi:O-antigen chain-terminating methyltransferase
MNSESDREVTSAPALAAPCAFSPTLRHGRSLATFYARRFQSGQRVLDIGFGQGHFLEAACKRGIEAVGVDRDSALVAAAQARGHRALDIEVDEIRRLRETFDGALAAHLIEHLGPSQVKDLLADVASLLVPGASFVIATPNFRDIRVATDWFWLDPTHVRPYPQSAVEQLMDAGTWRLDSSGFEPTFIGRDTPRRILNRIRFGRDYGRPGRWYQLRRI